MNFLELTQDLHRRAGASGVPPSTIEGLPTGSLAELLRNSVRRAEYYIQNMWLDWDFLWADDFSQATEVGIRDMVPQSVSVGLWDSQTFRIDGDKLPYDEWKDVKHQTFLTGVNDRNLPSQVFLMPNGNLRFDPVPDAAYTITAEYWKKPAYMAFTNDAQPVVPEDTGGHELIVARALIIHGNYENAPEMVDDGMQVWEENITAFESLHAPNQDSGRKRASQGEPIEVIAQ